jgi:hypothetical protein
MLETFIRSIGLVLVVGVASHASIIGVVTKQVNPGDQTGFYAGFARNQSTNPAPSGPFAADTSLNSGSLANTWVSYLLGVKATNGEKISGMDVSITTTLAPTQGFHQAWTPNEEDPAHPTPTPSGISIINGDSHLMPGAVVVVAPAENRFTSGGPPFASPNTATKVYGVGSSLTGVWGYDPGQQAAQQNNVPVNFAYIVVPRGFEPQITIDVEAAGNDSQGVPLPQNVILNNQSFACPFACEAPAPIVNLINIGERELSAGTISQALSATSILPVTGWTNLVQTMGPTPAIAPTLAADGTFTWNPAGSKAGKKGSGAVTYQWAAVASDFLGPGALMPAFQVTLIPEPVSALIAALGLATLLGSRRRR